MMMVRKYVYEMMMYSTRRKGMSMEQGDRWHEWEGNARDKREQHTISTIKVAINML